MEIMTATASLAGYNTVDALAKAHELGFTGVCLFGMRGARHSQGVLAGFFWGELSEAERDELRTALEPFTGINAIHAPFQDLPLASTNPYVEKEALRQQLESIEAAGALGLDIVTVHAARPRNVPLEDVLPRLVATLRQMGDAAQAVGARIGLENVAYPSDPDEHVELLDAVDHPAVGATLDVGHISFWMKREGINELHGDEGAAQYNDWLARHIDRLGERIIHLHVHDVRLPDIRDHRAVGRGIIDFDRVRRNLEALNFTGALEFELEEPDIEQALIESRAHLQRVLGQMV